MVTDDLATEVSEQPTATSRGAPTAFRVTTIAGPDVGKTLRIEPSSPSSVLVGKSAACQLTLAGDPKVSRRHASFEVVDDRLRLMDLGSTNGTTVNGIVMIEALLHGGETIGMGSTMLQVVRETAAPSRLSSALSFGRFIGTSTAIRKLYPMFERLSTSDIPIIIEGETGTGKELLAEVLHEAGPRRAQPFVVFDCSTVAPTQIASAFFGEGNTRGAFESAHQGTVLIDEVTELPSDIQQRLLRAIERGEMSRVGSDQWQKVSVRTIATTRRDLEKEVEAGRFREDLFFRLAVGRVELPPLRRRRPDVALLADYFWKRLDEGGEGQHPLPRDFLRRYDGYAWPGNVRELQNAVARRFALGDIDPDANDDDQQPDTPDGAPEHAFQWVLEQDLPFSSARDLVASEFVRHYVERVLKQHNGNVSHAAAASGLARRYFQILRAGKR